MSAASQLEAEGTDAHFATSGESVTFRGSAVTCDINRPTSTPPDRLGDPDFSIRDQSEVEFLVEDITQGPKRGEKIVESNGLRHRIERVHRIGLVYHCQCKVEAAP